jgi:FlaA1/EpsC-like NDP-sugar epimerase
MIGFFSHYKKAVFIIFDILSIVLSLWLAFLLRFEWNIPLNHFLNMVGMIFLSLAFLLPVFYRMDLYSFSWSFVSANEMVRLFKGVSLGYLFLGASLFLLKDHYIFSGFPRSTVVMSFFFVFLFCGAGRFAKRIYLQVKGTGMGKNRKRTLIVGSGNAGEQILRSIMQSRSSYLPVGFIDDIGSRRGISIHGLKVLGRIEDISKVVEREKIEAMIIAMPSAGSALIKEAARRGREAGLKEVKIVPSMEEIIGGRISVENLKSLQAEDLLGRDQVFSSFSEVEKFISGKKVLVTGAAGSIGSELCMQIAGFSPNSLLILDQDETGIFNIENRLKKDFPEIKIVSEVCDIVDEEKVKMIFNDFFPETVFHAAAYKHVPLMESHPEEAVKNNIFGTKILAEAALDSKVEKFIFISTDKAVNPTSVMGASKRAGEMICQSLNGKGTTKFVSVRFGNVLDSRGSVIPIFKEQIRSGGPVTVTDPEMKRYFMTSKEACLLVMEAGAIGEGGEIFVLDMGKPVKILDMAREMIRLSGLEPDKDISIVFTGKRPGEKLFEEILTAEEGTEATEHKKIFKARLSEANEKTMEDSLKDLKEAAKKLERERIIAILKELIPKYE